MVLRWIAFCVAVALAASACRKRGNDSIRAEDALPTLRLSDDTPGLLLTWLDGHGETHVSERIADVPLEGRTPVRVVAGDAGQGQLVYVADLTLRQEDGSYSVRTMPRSEWEQLIEARRAKVVAMAPPAAPVGPDAPRQEATEPVPAAGFAIVYGAEWCGPCHQAQAFLERAGVPVTFYDIEKEPRRGDEMREKLRKAGRNGGSIPVIDVGGRIFVGYSPGALQGAVARMKRGGATPL